MSFASRIAPAAAIVLASCLSAPASSSPAIAQVAAAGGVAGSWIGAPFGSGDWVFEFRQQDDIWSGRCKSVGSDKWHDLRSLNASGKAATFEIASTPVVRFVLQVDASGRAMSGTTNIGSSLSLPFSAMRRA